jgi:hypothetical protein
MQLKERGKGRDLAAVTGAVSVVETAHWKPRWTIRKFQDPNNEIARLAKAGVPIERLSAQYADRFLGEMDFEGNLLLNEGINELWTLVAGTGATKFDNANAYIGVGDSSTAAVATDTDLNASSNKKYNAVDGGYPTYGSSQYATWRATFASGDANFHWQEITVCNTSSGSGKNLNHKVQDMGTKVSGTTWIATLQITLS